MKSHVRIPLAAVTALIAGALTAPSPAPAHILAMVNYESKTEAGLEKHGIENHGPRKEGIAIIDVDPQSKTFGKIAADIPLPSNLVGHHIFYNRDMSKAYVTALGQGLMYVMDMKVLDYRLKTVRVAACKLGEDLVFSPDNSTWYLTCMGSANVIVGDAATDTVKSVIATPHPWPHGIAINADIDRILITGTVSPDLKSAGETITVIEASTGKVLDSYKTSLKDTPSGAAPVEVLFAPKSSPATAYITNMFGHTLWKAAWQSPATGFAVSEAFDFATVGAGVPLEMYFNETGSRLYVTTASPGNLHIFDVAQNQAAPKLLKTLPAAAGAHHVAFTKDWHYAFVQNALLNLEGMDDGAITVIDLQKQEVVASVDTLKKRGLNPNSIVLLPQWNHLAGH